MAGITRVRVTEGTIPVGAKPATLQETVRAYRSDPVFQEQVFRAGAVETSTVGLRTKGKLGIGQDGQFRPVVDSDHISTERLTEHLPGPGKVVVSVRDLDDVEDIRMPRPLDVTASSGGVAAKAYIETVRDAAASAVRA